MFARILEEHGLEVGTAYSQHDLVGLQQFAIASQSTVDKVAAIEQILETCC